MTIDVRMTKPCSLCLGTEACMTVRREFEATRDRLIWIAHVHKVQLPDIDVVLDCQSYAPVRNKTKPRSET